MPGGRQRRQHALGVFGLHTPTLPIDDDFMPLPPGFAVTGAQSWVQLCMCHTAGGWQAGESMRQRVQPTGQAGSPKKHACCWRRWRRVQCSRGAGQTQGMPTTGWRWRRYRCACDGGKCVAWTGQLFWWTRLGLVHALEGAHGRVKAAPLGSNSPSTESLRDSESSLLLQDVRCEGAYMSGADIAALERFARLYDAAELYAAYAPIASTMSGQFAACDDGTLLNAASFIASRCLGRAGGGPPGVSLAAALYVLASRAAKAGAFKTARLAYSKLQVGADEDDALAAGLWGSPG